MRKLEEMTDEQLALAYVEGDNRAFDLLLSRNEVKLFGYIMFVVHDQEKANDVFQETFVKVVTKLQGFLPCIQRYLYWMSQLRDLTRREGTRFWIRWHSFTKRPG